MSEPRDRVQQQLLDDFGDRLRRLRRAQGFTQEQLADAAGLHRTYIGHVERGASNLTLISMAALADALKVDLYDLVAGLNLR